MTHFKRHIFVCTNARPAGNPKGSCAEKGAEELLGTLKAAMRQRGLKHGVRANKSGCLDACEHGITLVVYPEAVWYRNVTLADIDELVDEHLVAGRPVSRLLIPAPTEASLDV